MPILVKKRVPNAHKKTAEYQLTQRFHLYRSKGGKRWRKEQFSKLITRCSQIFTRFNIHRLEQIGKKQILWHDEQLRQVGRADKTRMSYFHATVHLWEVLGRSNQPPRPLL
jgi:hypothetical protein